MDPCELCGGKPNRARRVMHRKGCQYYGLDAGVLPVLTKEEKEYVPKLKEAPGSSGNTITVKIPHFCCNEVMVRTDGAPYESSCRHFRLLTSECSECRQHHNGVLIYRCKSCGREMVDSPHLAQGDAAMRINMIAR